MCLVNNLESKVRKLKTNAKSPKKVDVHEEPVESMNSDSNSDGYEMEVESEEESGSQYDTETDTTETEDSVDLGWQV